MASTICGWCGDHSHLALMGDVSVLPDNLNPVGVGFIYTGAFRCSSERCRRISVGTVYRSTRYQNPPTDMPADSRIQWEPSNVRRPLFPFVPAEIASAASEAHTCLSVDAYRGAVALARAVVEATAKDKGITSGSLVSKIDKMHQGGLIRAITKEIAHEIRHGGNEIAHGDLANDPMPPEDAEAIVKFMDSILQEVYQGPGEMEDLRKSREEREKRNKGNGV
ncbi:DUF4145 domain-containing protein [Streptomyces sp. NPDC056069]|uniref:DUF4145 domain-containing protein n=1 Tax=Streptomyces sp. NPDC056069 TaxID=3345702 RepID=UPI0035DB2945